ncbi:hypothetical protein BGZ60DRAFT_431709 [Tricladium varicosporioides]|nr:hypothetical protein BGZ60DRAFT_431709 [Hymenoscyphus varicosporioides]
MHFQGVFIKTVSILAVSQSIVTALPTEEINSLETRAKGTKVKCDDISKYTVPYFISKTCKRPAKSSCLFYTRGLSSAARTYAKADGHSMTTIWEIWPSSWYNNNVKDTKNPLRCIIQDKAKRGTYFTNMSTAMAQMCDIFATVMTKDINNVPQDGIWAKAEFPTLQASGNQGKVLQIEMITQDGKQTKHLWVRGKKARRALENRQATPEELEQEEEVEEEFEELPVEERDIDDFDPADPNNELEEVEETVEKRDGDDFDPADPNNEFEEVEESVEKRQEVDPADPEEELEPIEEELEKRAASCGSSVDAAAFDQGGAYVVTW